MTTTTTQTSPRLGFRRNVQRAACTLAQTALYFSADDLARACPKPPPGVDPLNIGGALNGPRAIGLIEPVAYGRMSVVRAHGRPQAVWKVLDPEGCGEWLRRNPPGPMTHP
jgi:hypothetical protein